MKKIFGVLLIVLLSTANISHVNAETTTEYEAQLEEYIGIIEKVNQVYNVDFYILGEEEFYKTKEINLLHNNDYNNYLNSFLNYNLVDFEKCLIDSLRNINDDLSNVNNVVSTFSTQGQQRKRFNASHNEMILTYWYNGRKFDSSKTPEVKVNDLNYDEHFVMDSHTITYLNTYSTCRVTAKGRVIIPSLGVARNNTFIVDFRL